jgi:hypothetical protein
MTRDEEIEKMIDIGRRLYGCRCPMTDRQGTGEYIDGVEVVFIPHEPGCGVMTGIRPAAT